jgi:hypothetical protein
MLLNTKKILHIQTVKQRNRKKYMHIWHTNKPINLYFSLLGGLCLGGLLSYIFIEIWKREKTKVKNKAIVSTCLLA